MGVGNYVIVVGGFIFHKTHLGIRFENPRRARKHRCRSGGRSEPFEVAAKALARLKMKAGAIDCRLKLSCECDSAVFAERALKPAERSTKSTVSARSRSWWKEAVPHIVNLMHNVPVLADVHIHSGTYLRRVVLQRHNWVAGVSMQRNPDRARSVGIADKPINGSKWECRLKGGKSRIRLRKGRICLCERLTPLVTAVFSASASWPRLWPTRSASRIRHHHDGEHSLRRCHRPDWPVHQLREWSNKTSPRSRPARRTTAAGTHSVSDTTVGSATFDLGSLMSGDEVGDSNSAASVKYHPRLRRFTLSASTDAGSVRQPWARWAQDICRNVSSRSDLRPCSDDSAVLPAQDVKGDGI